MRQTASFRYRIEKIIARRIEDLVRHAIALDHANDPTYIYTYSLAEKFAMDMDNPNLQLLTINKVTQEDIMATRYREDDDRYKKPKIDNTSAMYMAKNMSVDELLDERNNLKKVGLCYEKIDMALQLKYK